MPERFTETLRAASEAGWSHAVQHRFVNQLFAGAVGDGALSHSGPPLARQFPGSARCGACQRRQTRRHPTHGLNVASHHAIRVIAPIQKASHVSGETSQE